MTDTQNNGNVNPPSNQGPSYPQANVPGGQVQPSGSQAPYQPAQSHAVQQPVQHAGTQQPAQHAAQPYAYSQPAPDYRQVQPSGSIKVHKSGSSVKTFFVAFAGAACACLLFLGGTGLMESFSDEGAKENPPAVQKDESSKPASGSQGSNAVSGKDAEPTLAESVAQKCLPSVVAIDVYARQAGMYGAYGMYGYSMQDSGELVQSSLGSGVVLTQDGYIVTNYHVIEGGEAFTVTIEGEAYDAEVVGSDPSSDIAVLKAIDASGLTPMEIGDSDNLIIGEWVMSLGSPFGLEQSVATGIVSATSRSQIMEASTDMYGQSTGETTIYPNMIQTDAAINPGNSGGALVDAEGKLIGINTLITSYSGNYSGVGFAIPANYAVSLAQQIMAGEEPTHAQLGVSLTTVNSAMAQRYGLAADEGAYVAYVYPGTGAAAAGLQEGDIVVAFDGKAVGGASDLMLDVRTKSVGDTVTLTVNRSGEVLEVPVTLGSDAQTLVEEQPQTQQNSLSDIYRYLFGNKKSLDSAA